MDLDISSVEEACEILQTACQREHIPEEPWYDWLQTMNQISLPCLQEAGEY